MPPSDQLDLFSASPVPKRIFLDWSRPLLEQAADWLIARAGERTVLDLSDLLVIVPTRNAGRRLREMLANLAAERGTAVIPPLAVPPSILTRPEDGAALTGKILAGDLEAISAWITVLERIDLNDFRALFPIDPPTRDFTWTRGTARDLSAVRRTLGEAGLGFADVLKRLPEGHEEKERWQDLANLENEWLRFLDRNLNRCDREQARAMAARRPTLPVGVREVVVIGSPDPIPLAADALENLLTRGVPITVAVYAPDSFAEHFDSWGHPQAEFWQSEAIAIPDFQQTVEVVANPAALIDRVTQVATAIEDPADTLAIGAIDAELAPLLESALKENHVTAFNPEGGKVKHEGFHHLMRVLSDLLSQSTFSSLRELLRIPEVDRYLNRKLEAWNGQIARRAIDDSHSIHLATDLPSILKFLRADADASRDSEWEREQRRAGEFIMAATGLDEIRRLIKKLGSGPLPETLPPILGDLIGSRNWKGEDGAWAEKVIEAAAPSVMAGLSQLSEIDRAGVDLIPAQQLTLLLDFVGEIALSEDRPSLAIELQGWLELLWEDAPCLIVAGLNDGIVPEAIVGHPYLPENLRSLRSLRLKTNDDRLVRDLYVFRALLESRLEGEGRISVLVPKTSANGDPLRPSRLLFRCEDAELPGRVKHVFQEATAPGTQDSWAPGFPLVPNHPHDGEPDREIKKLAVTAFGDYLASPFHFWAGRIRRNTEIDPAKAEMDNFDFGNFCHLVLEEFGADESARNWTNPEDIENFLLETADRLAGDRWGKRPPLAVRIQLASARERLRAVADVQAREREAGWEIIHIEESLVDRYALELGGIAITGKIDRVERNGDHYRVIDYKTSDSKPSGGAKSDHCVGNRLADDAPWPPDYAFFDLTGKSMRWKKLQLPLYCLALAEHHPDAELTCGYFHLTKAVADVGVDAWAMDSEILNAARQCAEGVIADVIAGKLHRLEAKGDRDWLTSWHLGLPEKTLDLTFLGGSPTTASQIS